MPLSLKQSIHCMKLSIGVPEVSVGHQIHCFYFQDKKEVCEQLQNECDTSDKAMHHANQYWLCASYL